MGPIDTIQYVAACAAAFRLQGAYIPACQGHGATLATYEGGRRQLLLGCPDVKDADRAVAQAAIAYWAAQPVASEPGVHNALRSLAAKPMLRGPDGLAGYLVPAYRLRLEGRAI